MHVVADVKRQLSSFVVMTTSRLAAVADVATTSTDALNHVPVTTALMVACEEEDIDEVRKLLSADEVRANNT